MITAVAAIVATAGLAGLDERLAGWTAPPSSFDAFAGAAVSLLDLIALKEISNFLLGTLLLVAGGLLLLPPRTRRSGWFILYWGLVQLLATTVADLAKPQLGRLRPWEAAETGMTDVWFAGANSFPSGHAAFYAGLFLPLILLAPRLRLLWLVLATGVAASRVLVHDHYLSDVAVSVALAAALAAAFLPLARRGQLRDLSVA